MPIILKQTAIYIFKLKFEKKYVATLFLLLKDKIYNH